jgi:signal transduction histidine kinase/CheY-like chemotaxis protein
MPGTILVAEDDPEARELLRLVLGPGYHVLAAADGVEAYEMLRRERPDLLITDIVMPRMDGYELVRKVREQQSTADLPVIFCSASYHEREVREMARELGVVSTLAKPYDHDLVRSIVADALAARLPTASCETDVTDADAARCLHEAQERLNAMVAFSRRLFAEADVSGIAACASGAAREILFAQCAQVFLGEDATPELATASGIEESELAAVLASPLYAELRARIEQGQEPVYPESPRDTSSERGQLTSLLGVPIASATRRYGYLCVVNRIGLRAFTAEDVGIARAIAAQVAMAYENATRCHALQAEIARRSAMEEQVRRLNRELEARVRERTAELECANRELETFAYSVAHDLRAPLRSIDAQVQLLCAGGMGALPRPVVVQLEQIRRGAEHMSALIDGLLAISRVRHAEMSKQRVALGDLVSRTLTMLASEVEERPIEWRIHPLPTVECDEELILQVFVNLIHNAIKYTRPRTQPVIEIGYERGERPNVYVRDNGVGFDMRYAAKLFGPFQRLHRQDEFEGTGVGLATVSRIVERHGGQVWAESTLGEGAVFHVMLPGM